MANEEGGYMIVSDLEDLKALGWNVGTQPEFLDIETSVRGFEILDENGHLVHSVFIKPHTDKRPFTNTLS